MTIEQVFQISRSRGNMLLTACLLLLCVLTIASDLFFARWQGTGFYISESLLFCSFWLLFFPLLKIQPKLIALTNSLQVCLFFSVIATAVHLLAYPALVWLLSRLFYSHTFNYWQTLNFGISEHLIKAAIIYGISYPALFYRNRVSLKEGSTTNGEVSVPTYLTTMIVTDTNNRKCSIAVSEILYFSANPPYVTIYHATKKYLQTGTLKLLESRLQAQQFVRIHRSLLVNVRYVKSYQSRLNGDYDLTLADGSILRVSRNYAAAFKKSFYEYHQLKAK